MPDPMIEPSWSPTYAERLANHIVYETESMERALESASSGDDCHRIKHEWAGRVLQACTGTLEGMQSELDQWRKLAMERIALSSGSVMVTMAKDV